MTAAADRLEADVLAAMERNPEAFGRLVAATQKLVTSITFAKTGDPVASADLAQEIYLAVWEGIHRLQKPGSFLPWLKQLSRNQVHDALRCRQRDRSITDDAVVATAVDPAPDAASYLLAAEERAIVEECIDALADDARELLTLFYREGSSVKQVASLLELKEATVKKRLERARRSVRSEVLARFADLARKTAPSSAFTALVMTSLSLPAGTASASTAAASTVAASTAKPLASKLGAAMPAVLGAFALGTFGVFLYFHGYGQGVSEPQKTRQLRRLALLEIGTVLFVCLGITLAATMASPAILWASWILAAVVHGWVFFLAVPRLLPVASGSLRRALRWAIPAFGLVAGTVTVAHVSSLLY